MEKSINELMGNDKEILDLLDKGDKADLYEFEFKRGISNPAVRMIKTIYSSYISYQQAEALFKLYIQQAPEDDQSMAGFGAFTKIALEIFN